MNDLIGESKSLSAGEKRAPALSAGDVLDAAEYWKRAHVSPDRVTSERINRKVYIMSPVKAASHGRYHSLLNYWLASYASTKHDLEVFDNATVRLDPDNDPQPDLCLCRIGGASQLDAEGYLTGSPELVVEVAGSSASHDLGEKRLVYEKAQVGEYLVYEAFGGQVYWWTLEHDRYRKLEPQGAVYRSAKFADLWLDADALRNADPRQLLRTLNEAQ